MGARSESPERVVEDWSGREHLDVHVRLVVGETNTTVASFVDCPRRCHSVAVDECQRCERFVEVTTEPNENRSLLVCTSAPSNDDSSLQSGRDSPSARAVPISALVARRVICVRPDLPVRALVTLLLENEISGVPVVDARGRAVGVVSKSNLVRKAYGNPGHLQAVDTGTVVDIMTPQPLVLPEGASVAQAAAVMAFEGVHRLVVVSANEQVVGVVSSIDVLRWLARQGGFLVPDTTQLQRG